MTIKRTRPDRSEAMKGKPGLNPNGRPAPEVKIIKLSENKAELWYGNQMLYGDIELVNKCEKALMRGRKK